jgi:hypothetical protein
MDGAWEDLGLGENGESVVKVGNVVLCYVFVCIHWLVTLQIVSILRNPSQMFENSLTVKAVLGSYLATRKAVVDVSTVLKILLRMKGFDEKRRY